MPSRTTQASSQATAPKRSGLLFGRRRRRTLISHQAPAKPRDMSRVGLSMRLLAGGLPAFDWWNLTTFAHVLHTLPALQWHLTEDLPSSI